MSGAAVVGLAEAAAALPEGETVVSIGAAVG